MVWNRTCSVLASVVVVAAACAGGGCSRNLDYQLYDIHKKASFKIGEQWIIKPPHEINATGIEITRTIEQIVEKGIEPPPLREQTLVIDLTNGRATLQDHDGKRYPQQIDLKKVEQIHNMIALRSWQVSRIKPKKDADIVTHYVMTVFEQEQPNESQAQWAMPAREELPEGLQMLTDTFDVAHRFAYPLSQNVNLLK